MQNLGGVVCNSKTVYSRPTKWKTGFCIIAWDGEKTTYKSVEIEKPGNFNSKQVASLQITHTF